MNYENQKQILKDAYWFVEHDQIYTAISLVDDAFDNFIDFRAWYLTNSSSEYQIFDKHFTNWVAKIMVLLWLDQTEDKDILEMVGLTYFEIYNS